MFIFLYPSIIPIDPRVILYNRLQGKFKLHAFYDLCTVVVKDY